MSAQASNFEHTEDVLQAKGQIFYLFYIRFSIIRIHLPFRLQ